MDCSRPNKYELLIRQVIQDRFCVSCGACVDFCPYFQYIDGKVVALDTCEAETKRCESVCPRTDLFNDSLERIKRKAKHPLEGVERMNTIIIRNDIETKIIKRALDKKMIEVSEISESQLKHLEFAAEKKRKQGRAMKEEMKRTS